MQCPTRCRRCQLNESVQRGLLGRARTPNPFLPNDRSSSNLVLRTSPPVRTSHERKDERASPLSSRGLTPVTHQGKTCAVSRPTTQVHLPWIGTSHRDSQSGLTAAVNPQISWRGARTLSRSYHRARRIWARDLQAGLGPGPGGSLLAGSKHRSGSEAGGTELVSGGRHVLCGGK